MNINNNILVTGGAGFIGSHVIRLLVNKYPNYNIINLDKLTYAGNLENIKDVEQKSNYTFIKGDIVALELLRKIFKEHNINAVIHLAAESHVDRSITDPLSFIQTNLVGTSTLLIAAKEYWGEDFNKKLFYHVSTDEVYGSLGEEGMFLEDTPYDPRSPYSASKAGSDHMVRAFYHTYKMPVVISNCSNNYGSHQFPEKLIPLFFNNILKNKALPVYGKGLNIRDWLWVEDHATAIDEIFHHGKIGDTYNIGGENEWTNIDLINMMCDLMDEKLNRKIGTSKKLITYVKDRAGHDMRYAIDASKLINELNWKPSLQFKEGLSNTLDWYMANQNWVDNVTSGAYQKYYEDMYEGR